MFKSGRNSDVTQKDQLVVSLLKNRDRRKIMIALASGGEAPMKT